MTTIQRVFAFGCAGALITGGILAGVVAGNWSWLNGAYKTTSELLSVQSALQARFKTLHVSVMATSFDRERVLLIELVDPPFLEGADREQLQARAKEVAAAARDAYSSRESVDQYDIRFSKQSGFVFFSTSRFKVRASELPPFERTPARPPS